MGRNHSTRRRVAAAFALSLGLFAFSAPGTASAATVAPTLNGKADSQALRIRLTVGDDLILDQALSVMHGDMQRDLKTGSAGGFAALRQGSCGVSDLCTKVENALEGVCSGSTACLKLNDLQNQAVATRCVRGSACGAAKSIGGITLPLGELEAGDLSVKNKFGELVADGVTSHTPAFDRTKQTTGRARVTLDLASILGASELEATGALDTLYDVVNNQALPQVNDVIKTLKPQVDGVLDLAGLEDYVTFSTINPLPDIRTADLIDATIASAVAQIDPQVRGDALGVLSQSSSKLLGLKILDGWVSADVLGLSTSAYANGVAGGAKALTDVNISTVDIGGLLGINLPSSALKGIVNLEEAKKNLVATAPEALRPAAQDLIDVVELIQAIAGVDIRLLEEKTQVDPKGKFAQASAGTLSITFEPKIPSTEALTRLAGGPGADGGLIPTFTAADFTSAGLKLQIDLPTASSVSAATADVLPFNPPPRSGVATQALAGFALLAVAVLVRRFALAK